MVNRIALLIERQHLHLLQGTTGGQTIEPTLARSIRIPDSVRFEEAPDKFSDWLMQELADLGVSAKSTVFASSPPTSCKSASHFPSERTMIWRKW